MKKLFIFLTMIIFSISLCSCSGSLKKKQYTVQQGDTIFTIDTENGTISDGNNLYHYSVSPTVSGSRLDITYPDNSTYWWETTSSGGYGGWSDDYDENRYVSGDLLCEMLELDSSAPSKLKNIFLSLLLLIVGLFNLLLPRKAWNLERGWRYKNAEPSDAALDMHRFIGVVGIIAAIVIISL